MSAMCREIAQLDDNDMNKVHKLEEDIGASVMALEGSCRWAQLSDDQLNELQETEKDLGVVLLAYNR